MNPDSNQQPMLTEHFDSLLADLRKGTLSATDFLKKTKFWTLFTRWCYSHCMSPDDGMASLYIDMNGFHDSSVVKEYVEYV